MTQRVPHISELDSIRIPGQYRDEPSLIKAYLTGFMNAWNHAYDLSANGPDTRSVQDLMHDF